MFRRFAVYSAAAICTSAVCLLLLLALFLLPQDSIAAIACAWLAGASLVVVLVCLLFAIPLSLRISRRMLPLANTSALVYLAFAIAAYGLIYSSLGMVTANGITSYRLLDGLYLSVLTWTTVGYSDFSPQPHYRGIALF